MGDVARYARLEQRLFSVQEEMKDLAEQIHGRTIDVTATLESILPMRKLADLLDTSDNYQLVPDVSFNYIDMAAVQNMGSNKVRRIAGSYHCKVEPLQRRFVQLLYEHMDVYVELLDKMTTQYLYKIGIPYADIEAVERECRTYLFGDIFHATLLWKTENEGQDIREMDDIILLVEYIKDLENKLVSVDSPEKNRCTGSKGEVLFRAPRADRLLAELETQWASKPALATDKKLS